MVYDDSLMELNIRFYLNLLTVTYTNLNVFISITFMIDNLHLKTLRYKVEVKNLMAIDFIIDQDRDLKLFISITHMLEIMF